MKAETNTINSENKTISRPEFIFITGIGILLTLVCFYLSCHLNIDRCPDERMRFDLPLWILRHHKLPLGDDPELIKGNIWGHSYGFTPYLSSLFAVFNMWVVSFFTSDMQALLIAARFVNVLCYAVLYLSCYQISRELYKNPYARILFTVSVNSIPQLIFLSGYLNSDTISICFSSICVLFWIRAYKYGWSIKRCIFFGICLGLGTLTYYNAYAFILCSIFVFFFICIREKYSVSKIIKSAAIIFAVAFLVGGWFFVRNFILYDGDFLGLASKDASSELHAIEELKPSNRETGANLGLSFREVFFSDPVYNWFSLTWFSYIGRFGYMDVPLPGTTYIAYTLFMLVGGGAFVVSFFASSEKKIRINREAELKDRIFTLIIGIICITTPLILSLRYSYYTDYQPQGRYIMSMTLPLFLLVNQGYQFILGKIGSRFEKAAKIIYIAITVVLIAFTIVSVFCFIKPGCFTGTLIS